MRRVAPVSQSGSTVHRGEESGIVADLRAAAAEAGVQLTVLVEDGMAAVDEAQRFHLTVTSAGRLVVQGWWGSEATARRTYLSWVGEYGSMPDARITLIDERRGRTLLMWSAEA